MQARITIIDRASPAAGAMADRLIDVRPALRDMLIALVRISDMHFRHESDPRGVAWRPLSRYTIAGRRQGPKTGRREKILQDTGRLRASVMPGQAIQRIGATKLEYGTNLVYAPTHQFGAKFTRIIKPVKKKALRWIDSGGKVHFARKVTQRVTIPARPFLGVSVQDVERLVAILRAHIGDRLQEV